MDDSLKQQLRDSGLRGDIDLESLIGACGEELSSLDRNASDSWEAIMGDDIYGDSKGFTKGQTPIEAVAKLWLELHKHDTGKTN